MIYIQLFPVLSFFQTYLTPPKNSFIAHSRETEVTLSERPSAWNVTGQGTSFLSPLQSFFFLIFIFFSFIFVSWRLITSQHFSGFVIHWHESAMELHVFPIPIPPPTSLSTRFLWVFPVHQARALVSCVPPGLVICFTIDNIHAVLLKHPTLAFSHRVQKSVLYICVSFSVLRIGLSLSSF